MGDQREAPDRHKPPWWYTVDLHEPPRWFTESQKAEYVSHRTFVTTVIFPQPPSWYTPFQRAGFWADEVAMAMGPIAKFKQAFSLFDKDNNGTISATELVHALEALGPEGQNIQQHELKFMINELDVGGSGTIHLEPFCAFMWRLVKPKPGEACWR